MTNAKSRLVRVIAFALAMLMVVMAFAACGSKPAADNGVDKETFDAALKAVQDAADKAAQDAANAKQEAENAKQDAANAKQEAEDAKQDAANAKQEAENAKQEADKLQQELDNIKNTTAAPATTTAPVVVVDKATVDAYVASMLYGEDSEFNKIFDADKSIYSEDDAKRIIELCTKAAVAIQRADTVDYVNSLIAGLQADVAKIPTYSQRVKMAYDAIDLAANDDVIDVVYAANFIAEALRILKGKKNSNNAEIIDAEIAAIYAYGEDKLAIADIVATEYYRYTGNAGLIEKAVVNTAEVKVLYDAVYTSAKATGIADKIREIYGAASVGDELNVSSIVYEDTLSADVKLIADAYEAWYKTFNRKDYASLYADFCIAFVGEEYILVAEGDYLNEKLTAATERATALKTAANDYNKNIKNKLTSIVTDYNAKGIEFDAIKNNNPSKNTSVPAVAELLDKWIATYGFVDGDKNFDAIIGATVYADFIKCKAFVATVDSLFASAKVLDAASITAALEEAEDYGIFTYSKYYAAIAALDAWVESYIEAMAKYVADEDPANVTLTDINYVTILDEACELVVATDMTVLADAAVKAAAAKKVADGINNDIASLEVLKQSKIDAINDKIDAFVADYKGTQVLADGDEEMINYDLINIEGRDALQAAYDESIAYIQNEGSIIVKAYIGWQGVAAEDGIVYDGNTYDVLPFAVTAFSYEDIKSMNATYEKLKIADNDADIVIKLDAVDADEPIKFTLRQATDMYLKMHEHFYNNIWRYFTEDSAYNSVKGGDGELKTILSNALLNAPLGGWNEWKYGKSSATADESAAIAKIEAWNKAETGYKGKIKYATDTYASKVSFGGTLGYKSAIASVNPDSYLSSDKKTFDKTKYEAAVDAAITTNYKNWKAAYAKDVARYSTLKGYLKQALTFVLDFGLLKIEDTFTYAGNDYKFVLSTNTTKVDTTIKQNGITAKAETGLKAALYLYNEDGELVGISNNNTALVDGQKVTFVIDGKDVTIKLGSATLANAIKADLGEDYDAATAKSYVYNVMDYVDQIMANSDALGTVVKPYRDGNFYKISRDVFDNIYNAYLGNLYYAEMLNYIKYAFNCTETEATYLTSGYDIDFAVNKADLGKNKELYGLFARNVLAAFEGKATADQIKQLKAKFILFTDEQVYKEFNKVNNGTITLEEAEALVAYHVAKVSAIALEFANANDIAVTANDIAAFVPAFLND